MNIEQVREYCLSKPEATEGFPFGETTLVFKVFDKMFCLLSLEGNDSINLKCDPEKAIELREQFPCVQPGYHMNKKYWNTIYLDGSVQDTLVQEWIDHSFNEVVKKLPAAKRQAIGWAS